MSTESKERPTSLKLTTKLNESNYSLWYFQMEILLQEQELLELTDSKTTVWEIKNQLPAIVESPKARMCIVTNCNEAILTTLMLMKTAKEMWLHLYKTYSGENYSRKLEGIRSLASLSYNSGSVIDFMDKIFLKLNATIIASGKDEISLTELTLALMLNSLPNRFATVRAQLEQDVKNLTVSNVRSKIKEEEQRHAFRKETSDGFAGNINPKTCQHNRVKTRCWTCTPSSHPSNAKCKDCNQTGHRSATSTRCTKYEGHRSADEANGNANATIPHRVIDDQQGYQSLPKPSFYSSPQDVRYDLRHRINSVVKKAPSNDSCQHVAKRQKATTSKDVFVFDSGCSQSILFNKEKLSNYIPFTMNMLTANNGTLKCIGKGDLVLNHAITVQNVLYCPEVSLNLISTSQLCDMGLALEMNDRRIVIKRKTEVVLIVPRTEGLYSYCVPQERALLAKGSSRTELSHRRLGHLNYKSLRLLSHLSDGVNLDNDPPHNCDICARAKATKTPFPPSKSLASKIGELTHADVCHVGLPTILGRFTMFLILIDDSTRLMTIKLLTQKSECIKHIIAYDRKVFNLTGSHLTTFRSDNGGEFINADLLDYFKEFGIHAQTSTPYTPEQNGRAERANRSVLEGTSALLLDCQLPLNFWGLAAETFVYLKNRSPHAKLHRSTPYEHWYKQVPDLTNVRVFGYGCYVFIPAEVRKTKGLGHKLLPKATKMVFVGYADNQKGWKCYNPETNSIVVSSNVHFDSESIPINGARATIPSLLETLFPDFPLSQARGDTISSDSACENESQRPETLAPQSLPSTSVEPTNSDSESSVDLSEDEAEEDTALLALQVSNDCPDFYEAMQSSDSERWTEAIQKEYKSLTENKVFSEPILLPNGHKALDTKMVLKIKEAEYEGAPRRYKARLCGKGYRQTHMVNYFDTYAPVATYNTLRIFLTMMAGMDYEMDVIDVTTAFLLSPIKEDIYINIPSGYPIKAGQERMVLKLNKCLYGLKQAPMEWNNQLNSHLIVLGFKPTVSDPCVYVREADASYILVYVDDMIIACKTRLNMQAIKTAIMNKFPCTDKGPISVFLNMHIKRNRNDRTISISQPVKIDNVLNDSKLSKDDRKRISTPSKVPALPDVMLTKEMCPTDDGAINAMKAIPYKSILGQLLFIAITARPDLATAVSACGKFAHNPGRQHWEAILQILKYLQGTRLMTLTLGGKLPSFTLTAYCDADWAGDKDARKSRTGYVLMINKSPVIWSSKLQQSVALSSTEAEYISTCSGATAIIWTRQLLEELGHRQGEPTTIYQDNKACINIALSRKQQPGIKHIAIRHFFLRERVATGDVILVQVSTLDMVADIFTKQLAFPAFAKHRKALCLQ